VDVTEKRMVIDDHAFRDNVIPEASSRLYDPPVPCKPQVHFHGDRPQSGRCFLRHDSLPFRMSPHRRMRWGNHVQPSLALPCRGKPFQRPTRWFIFTLLSLRVKPFAPHCCTAPIRACLPGKGFIIMRRGD